MPKWVFDMPMFVAPTYSCNPFSAMEKLLWGWGDGGEVGWGSGESWLNSKNPIF